VSLRKSPTLTPALLAANRRNAQKATGPRTERGKNWSRVNRLRTGTRSRSFRRLMDAVLAAMPGEVRQTARALLPPHLARHPLYVEFVEGIVETDLQLSAEAAARRRRFERFQKSRSQGGPVLVADVNPAPVGFPPATSGGLVGHQGLWAKQKMTFQPGMSLKTNEGVDASRHGSDALPAAPAAFAGAGRMSALRKTTFQPGMSLKTNESVSANGHESGVFPPAPAAFAGGGRMPALHKMTFQPGMSLKTNESVSASCHEKGASPTAPAAPKRTTRMRTHREDLFDDGAPIDPNELTDEEIATILDKSRKSGMSQKFFDWVEREILAKRSVPSRNVVDKQAPRK
jgi:hypothetical protein